MPGGWLRRGGRSGHQQSRLTPTQIAGLRRMSWRGSCWRPRPRPLPPPHLCLTCCVQPHSRWSLSWCAAGGAAARRLSAAAPRGCGTRRCGPRRRCPGPRHRRRQQGWRSCPSWSAAAGLQMVEGKQLQFVIWTAVRVGRVARGRRQAALSSMWARGYHQMCSARLLSAGCLHTCLCFGCHWHFAFRRQVRCMGTRNKQFRGNHEVCKQAVLHSNTGGHRADSGSEPLPDGVRSRPELVRVRPPGPTGSSMGLRVMELVDDMESLRSCCCRPARPPAPAPPAAAGQHCLSRGPNYKCTVDRAGCTTWCRPRRLDAGSTAHCSRAALTVGQ